MWFVVAQSLAFLDRGQLGEVKCYWLYSHSCVTSTEKRKKRGISPQIHLSERKFFFFFFTVQCFTKIYCTTKSGKWFTKPIKKLVLGLNSWKKCDELWAFVLHVLGCLFYLWIFFFLSCLRVKSNPFFKRVIFTTNLICTFTAYKV